AARRADHPVLLRQPGPDLHRPGPVRAISDLRGRRAAGLQLRPSLAPLSFVAPRLSLRLHAAPLRLRAPLCLSGALWPLLLRPPADPPLLLISGPTKTT